MGPYTTKEGFTDNKVWWNFHIKISLDNTRLGNYFKDHYP